MIIVFFKVYKIVLDIGQKPYKDRYHTQSLHQFFNKNQSLIWLDIKNSDVF